MYVRLRKASNREELEKLEYDYLLDSYDEQDVFDCYYEVDEKIEERAPVLAAIAFSNRIAVVVNGRLFHERMAGLRYKDDLYVDVEDYYRVST